MICVSGLNFYPQGVGADPHIALALPPDSKLAKEKADEPLFQTFDSDEMTIRIGRTGPLSGKPPFIYPHHLLQVMTKPSNHCSHWSSTVFHQWGKSGCSQLKS